MFTASNWRFTNREEGNKLGFIDTNNCVKVDSFNTGEKTHNLILSLQDKPIKKKKSRNKYDKNQRRN
jgi:hypothetical protein